MKHEYTASYGRVRLQPLSEQDSQQYRLIRNREENRSKFVFSGLITEEAQKLWYTRYLDTSGDCMFSVYDSENRFIGGNAIYNISPDDLTAEYGRLLIDKERCRSGGWGYEATAAALKAAFCELGLKKVYLQVYADNTAACKTSLKAGFRCINDTGAAGERRMTEMEITYDIFTSVYEKQCF